ncbi:relaxin receptor 1-like [Zootermopsis nevadensis]|nr:relaxin receptor 1-like [Zootermopsis nevadensis]
MFLIFRRIMIKVHASWVIIWILLLQLATVTTCPLGCNCHRDNTNCRNASLTSVPANVTSNTTAIDISFNIISCLRNKDFVNLTHLKTIFLNNNNISQLEPYVFHQTKKLLLLYLNNNKIVEINDSLFQFLTNLKYLHLQDNRLRHIQPWLFKYNPDLLILDISGNNIINFEPNTFISNHILSWVNIKGNPLAMPVKWKTLLNSSLNVLDIEFCDAPRPSIRAFQNIPVLRMTGPKNKAVLSLHEFTSFQDILGLDVNEIMYLKLKLFRRLYSLSYGLIYNMTIGEDLNVVSLTGEDILCYCENQNLWFWCNEQSPTPCPKITTNSEKYKFLECDIQSYHVNDTLEDQHKSNISDKGRRNRAFWLFRHPVSWKTIRKTLLYASVPGCIIILVIGVYIVKRVRRQRDRKRTETSAVYSELNTSSSY